MRNLVGIISSLILPWLAQSAEPLWFKVRIACPSQQTKMTTDSIGPDGMVIELDRRLVSRQTVTTGELVTYQVRNVKVTWEDFELNDPANFTSGVYLERKGVWVDSARQLRSMVEVVGGPMPSLRIENSVFLDLRSTPQSSYADLKGVGDRLKSYGCTKRIYFAPLPF